MRQINWLLVETDKKSIEECVQKIFARLEELGYLVNEHINPKNLPSHIHLYHQDLDKLAMLSQHIDGLMKIFLTTGLEYKEKSTDKITEEEVALFNIGEGL